MSIKDLTNYNDFKIKWFENIDSTNIYAKSCAMKGEDIIAVADNQTAGKGRFARVWHNESGKNVLMSMVLRPKVLLANAPLISCAVALAIVSAIKKVCKIETQIKWPNDIYFKGKKLCGILIETKCEFKNIDFAVAGIGINVNQDEFVGEIQNKAISIKQIVKKEVCIEELFKAVVDEVCVYIQKLENNESLTDEYIKLSAVINKNVSISYGNEEFSGTCLGFSNIMEIIIGRDGFISKYNAGEISLCIQD